MRHKHGKLEIRKRKEKQQGEQTYLCSFVFSLPLLEPVATRQGNKRQRSFSAHRVFQIRPSNPKLLFPLQFPAPHQSSKCPIPRLCSRHLPSAGLIPNSTVLPTAVIWVGNISVGPSGGDGRPLGAGLGPGKQLHRHTSEWVGTGTDQRCSWCRRRGFSFLTEVSSLVLPQRCVHIFSPKRAQLEMGWVWGSSCPDTTQEAPAPHLLVLLCRLLLCLWHFKPIFLLSWLLNLSTWLMPPCFPPQSLIFFSWLISPIVHQQSGEEKAINHL